MVSSVLRSALDLWRGAALADAPDTALTGALQARLDELRKVAVEDLVDAELALGQHRRLAPELESLVTAEPLRERRWGQLMRALSGSGQQADALRAFQRAHEQDHLGLILAVSRLGEAAWRRDDIEEFAEMHADLLELGSLGRSPGVVTGATARLAHARLEQGELEEAQALARDALASSSESFMPVINGYAFKTAGLVNLRMGHVAEGRSQLRTAIEAFGRGTGNLGTGLAATCWVDLSRSYAGPDEIDDARDCAAEAFAAATIANDPWVLQHAQARLTDVSTAEPAPH